MKYSSSDSVVGAKKGLLPECCCGSVIECINPGFDAAACPLRRPPLPHVNCRRRGFDDDRGAARERLDILDELLSTKNGYVSATMTLHPILAPTALY